MSRFRALYGASPLHLLALLGAAALSGAAVLRLAEGPQALRIGAWALGALLVHDLVLFPLYALLDRSLLVRPPARRGDVNVVRVPALLSGLLLLLFWPVITGHSEGSFRAASGLDQDVYLTRYLLLVAALFLGSALLHALRRRRR